MTKRRDIDELLSDIDGQLGDVAHMSVAEAKQARTAAAVDRVIQTAAREHTCTCQMSYVPDRVTSFSRDAESADPGRWFWREDETRDIESAWLPCYNIPRDDATGACLAAITVDRIRSDNIGPDYWDVQQLFLDDLETYGVPPDPDIQYEGYKWLVPAEDTNNKSEFGRLNDYAIQVQQLQQAQQYWRDLPPFQVQRGPVSFNPPPPTFTWQDPATREVSYPPRVEAALEHLHRVHRAMPADTVEQLRALNPGHLVLDPADWPNITPVQGIAGETVYRIDVPDEVNVEVVEEEEDQPTVETYENSDGSTTTVYRFDVPDGPGPLPF